MHLLAACLEALDCSPSLSLAMAAAAAAARGLLVRNLDGQMFFGVLPHFSVSSHWGWACMTPLVIRLGVLASLAVTRRM